jgi:hypothetical protein
MIIGAIGAILATGTGGLNGVRASKRIPQKEKPSVSQRARTADEQAPDPQKERAVELLREALNSSSTIENVGERSLLVSRAAELIWSHDEPMARFSLSKTFQDVLVQYKDNEVIESTEKLARLDAALNRLIATMMRKDPNLAASAQQQLNEMRKEQLKGKSSDPSNKEKLSLAPRTVSDRICRNRSNWPVVFCHRGCRGVFHNSYMT